MEHEIACRCGKVILVPEGMAGSSLDCDCGEVVQVPSLGELRGVATAEAPPTTPDDRTAAQAARIRPPEREIIAPTRVWLRVRCGAGSSRQTAVMMALTEQAVWIQDRSRLRSVPLRELDVSAAPLRAALMLTPSGGSPGETLEVTFADEVDSRRWQGEIQSHKAALIGDTTPDDRPVREGAVLVRRAPKVSFEDLGRVECTYVTGECADRGAQLRAGIRGADAVVDVRREKCPELGIGAYRVTGRAVRAGDEDARKRLRWTWYSETVSALSRRMLWLLLVQAALLLLMTGFLTGRSRLLAATGETPDESLATAALGIGLYYGWPILLVVLLRILRWRELLGAAGLAVLAVTTLRGLAVVGAHLAAVFRSGVTPAEAQIGVFLDPVDWAFIFLGMAAFVRARRLSAWANEVLSSKAGLGHRPRRFLWRGLFVANGLFVLFCLVVTALLRYEQSSELLQPGIDPQLEHQALLAFNQGAKSFEKGDKKASAEWFLRSLGHWERLTTKPISPPRYRVNLARTLYCLSLIRREQGRADEVEAYLGRAVAIADQLGSDPSLDDDDKELLASAREDLAEIRDRKSIAQWQRKDEEADRKYEEAQVIEDKDGRRAERLIREAITAWEEVLPHATNPEYRKGAVSQLATAYLHLAHLMGELDEASRPEAELKKSIEYGEKAVELDPSRPLPRHNLDVARRSLLMLQDRAFREEINKLDRAGKFAEVIAAYQRSIKEQEARLEKGQARDLPVSILAQRLDRFAWFLAHCPVKRLRDTKAAVEHARRAATLKPDSPDHWFTLAMVQYRGGEWRDSLATLDTVKARQGELQASDWLLSAMDLHRLDRKREAREAMDQALEWMRERNRKAENDPMLQWQNRMIWPSIEALLREARSLLDGIDPSDPKAG